MKGALALGALALALAVAAADRLLLGDDLVASLYGAGALSFVACAAQHLWLRRPPRIWQEPAAK